MTKRTILFISHTAARTGAPINLLRFLTWFKAHSDIPFRVLLQAGGTLLSEFAALAPVDVLYGESVSQGNVLQRIAQQAGLNEFAQKARLKLVKERLLRENIGLIYSNTAMNGDVLAWFADMRCPVISHIHELDYYIQYHVGQQHFERVKKYTTRYIAISDAVKKNLVEQHQIAEKRIETIYDFLPDSLAEKGTFDAQRSSGMVRQRLDLPENAFLICASGTIDWRKGPDIFIQLAVFLRKHHPELPFYFLWVGGETEGRRYGQLQHDLFKSGVEQFVRFLGTQAAPLTYFAACDVFAMVSREEPFGLVFIESATLGKPTVCFAGSGGPEEFVEDDCGYVVPYLDVEAMAARCLDLYADPNLRRRFGARAQQKVRERHAIERVAPQILNVIQQFRQKSV